MSMTTYRGALRALPALLFATASVLVACESFDKKETRKVSAPEAFRTCQAASDCVLVANACDGCCDEEAVNRMDSAAFAAQVRKSCAGYTGAVCDCTSLPVETTCEAGRCGVRVLREGRE